MKFKGTHGNWNNTLVEVSEDNSNPYYYIQGINSESICIVRKDGSLTREELDANAKLIVYAPEMLNMMHKIVSYYKQNGNFAFDQKLKENGL